MRIRKTKRTSWTSWVQSPLGAPVDAADRGRSPSQPARGGGPGFGLGLCGRRRNCGKATWTPGSAAARLAKDEIGGEELDPANRLFR
jgi:hypothetical protein